MILFFEFFKSQLKGNPKLVKVCLQNDSILLGKLTNVDSTLNIRLEDVNVIHDKIKSSNDENKIEDENQIKSDLYGLNKLETCSIKYTSIKWINFLSEIDPNIIATATRIKYEVDK